MSRADTLRFRHHQAVLVAAVIATIGALPLAAARAYLLPVLLVPLVVAAWAWRSGTDADRRELRLRALVGSRRVPWEQVVELTADPRGRAVVRLADGQQLLLPAVRGVDLPRLVSITGQALPDPR
ncbi:PH domain-containing protein [Micromonospora rifamycinica]|uniref:PH domain-containing protein n=1 Tax=Micromonospora rifamycinica TaxID=291594 RepID=A0A120F8X4_9ACTN|nr:PH domain-containing protein [Micromonospora rifamycinica]KWV32512.1 chemotaxis protein CheW [Micromonospora rifamycinica]SCG56143.1 PH domain-containing protein [Micromonospora rifamycinica]